MATQLDRSDRPSAHVPAWLIKVIWKAHRAALALTGGRFGLREPGPRRWGMLRLTTVGRRTGRTRIAIVGYIEDGDALVVPAMNGWLQPDPAWWLNLQSTPEATVVLPTGEVRAVVARAAHPDERARLWRRLVDLGTAAYTDGNARQRTRETAIVLLEPIRGDEASSAAPRRARRGGVAIVQHGLVRASWR